MKIMMEGKEEIVELSTLKQGDIFHHTDYHTWEAVDRNEIYMVTDSPLKKNGVVVVRLSNGHIANFFKVATVIKVNGILEVTHD